MVKYLVYLPIFFSPAYLIRFSLPGLGSINLLDFLLLAASSGLLLLSTGKDVFAVLKGIFLENLHFYIALGLVLSGFIVSYLLNIDQENWPDGLGYLKSFLLLPIFFGISCQLAIDKGRVDPKALLWAFLYLAACLGIIGYIYAILDIFTYDQRLSAFFESPNQLSMLLVPGIIAGLALADRKLGTAKLSFLILAIIFALFSLYLSRSSGALFSLLLVASLHFAIKFKLLKISQFKKSVFFFVFAFSALAFLAPQLKMLAGYQENSPATAFDSRIMIYSVSQKISNSNFLFGIGPGNFQQQYLALQQYFSPYPQWAVPHAHNNLLHFLVEGGIVSALGLFLIIHQIFFKIKTPHWGLVMVMAYLCIHGTVDTTIWGNQLAVYWWVAAIVTGSSQRQAV